MAEVMSGDVRISYDVVGQGRPLMLLHGWCCDRSWWTQPGYIDELRSDHRLVNMDVRGHGMSEKPHEAAAYTSDALIGDVFAAADAEGLDQFAIWGQSYGGWIGWMSAAAAPERIPALVASGSWDPRPPPEEPTEPNEWAEALRRGGTSALVDRFEMEDGAAFDREFPQWAREIALRADQRRCSPRTRPSYGPRGSLTRTSGRSPSRRSSSPGNWRTWTTTPRTWPR